MRSGGRLRVLAAGTRWLRLVAAPLGLAALLVACATLDPIARSTCIAVVPALETGDTAITIEAIESSTERRDAVQLRYHLGSGGDRSPEREITCFFGEDVETGNHRTLMALRTDEGFLPDARLYLLKRFWLADPGARGEGAARLSLAPTAHPQGLLHLDPVPALWLQHLVDAAAPCALYALLALACALIYGLIGRINFAFGDFATLGGFGALIGAVAVEGAGITAVAPMLGFAFLAAVVVAASWGGVLGRIVFRPLAFRAAQPLLVATVGLSIALQEFVARSQGVRERFLKPVLNQPLLLADGPFAVMVSPMRLAIVAVSTVLIVAVVAVLPRTRFGRSWRAVADDATMARLLGIDPARVFSVTFVLASALAGVAGAVLTFAYGGTSFHMGTVLGLKAVVAAIVGGIGSLGGAVLGGVLVGLIEALWTAAFGGEWRDTVVFGLLVMALILRPTGLFGTRAALEETDARP